MLLSRLSVIIRLLVFEANLLNLIVKVLYILSI